MNELRNGVQEMDLDDVPTSQENRIVSFGNCPMEGVGLEVQGESFGDISSRQFVGDITMHASFRIEKGRHLYHLLCLNPV